MFPPGGLFFFSYPPTPCISLCSCFSIFLLASPYYHHHLGFLFRTIPILYLSFSNKSFMHKTLVRTMMGAGSCEKGVCRSIHIRVRSNAESLYSNSTRPLKTRSVSLLTFYSVTDRRKKKRASLLPPESTSAVWARSNQKLQIAFLEPLSFNQSPNCMPLVRILQVYLLPPSCL